MKDEFYQDPVVPIGTLLKANERHDLEPHTVCMWQRSRYKGSFGYPPDPKTPKTRVKRVVDDRGNISFEKVLDSGK